LSIHASIQAAGVSDPIYHKSTFPNLTLKEIQTILDAIRERDKLLANYNSITIARVGMLFSGADSKITVQDLLPFSFDDKHTLNAETYKILKQLIKDKKLPSKVITAFSPHLRKLGRG
jgi:hypothetical protein